MFKSKLPFIFHQLTTLDNELDLLSMSTWSSPPSQGHYVL